MLLPIHVAAGGMALLFGASALVAKKGGVLHRRSGLLFVGAMLIMATTAAMLGNVGGGVITIYFVVTALTTVRPVSASTRWINLAALVVVVGLAVGTAVTGAQAINSPDLSPGGVPRRMIGVMSLFLATVMMLAAAGDVRVMRVGLPRGGARLARHLWRMCFALFIAAGSFFSIRERVARILPEPLTSGPMRLLPILLVFGVMFYWLWKVRARRRLSVIVRNEGVRLAP